MLRETRVTTDNERILPPLRQNDIAREFEFTDDFLTHF